MKANEEKLQEKREEIESLKMGIEEKEAVAAVEDAAMKKQEERLDDEDDVLLFWTLV